MEGDGAMQGAIGTSNEQAKRLSVTQRDPEMTKSFYLGRPDSGADDIFGSISARWRRRIGCIVDCFQDCVRRCLETNSGTRRQDGSKPGAKVISKQTVFRRRYCVPLIGMAGAVERRMGRMGAWGQGTSMFPDAEVRLG